MAESMEGVVATGEQPQVDTKEKAVAGPYTRLWTVLLA